MGGTIIEGLRSKTAIKRIRAEIKIRMLKDCPSTHVAGAAIRSSAGKRFCEICIL